MKKIALEQWLVRNGCTFHRHGSGHDLWRNLRTGRPGTLPRHREIKFVIVKSICKQLEIPLPPER